MIKFCFAVLSRLSPLLKKLLPRSVLRYVKQLLVNRINTALKRANPKPFDRAKNPDGVNIIGPLTSIMGLGQSCRIVAGIMAQTGIPCAFVDHSPLSVQPFTDTTYAHALTDKPKYNVNIIHINPHELPFAYRQLGRDVFDHRYNIMYWLWESEEFPTEWLPSLNLADEIWTPSVFSCDAIKKITDKPVNQIPYQIEAPTDDRFDRKHFNLPPDKQLFLCSYDSGSMRFRKNPDAAIAAYKQAFPAEHEDCGMVVKVGSAPQSEVKDLRNMLTDYDNVYFVTASLSKAEMNALIGCCDAYISLHRAEGFGLVCAEAMYLGKPVIATNWSANAEFMSAKTACVVDYQLRPLEKTLGPFKAGTRWAEPDTAQAAGYIRRLYTDEQFRRAIGRKAAEHIRRELNIEKAASAAKARCTQIWRTGK